MGNLQEELIKKLGARRAQTGRESPSKRKSTEVGTSAPEGGTGVDSWTTGVAPLKKETNGNTIMPQKTTAVTREPRKTPITQPAKSGAASTAAPHGQRRPIAQNVPALKGNTGLSSTEHLGKPPSSETPRVVPRVDFGAMRQPALAREQDFHEPAAWVATGRFLQAPEMPGQGRVLPVRIGIDFGTAYTKVAIRAADKVFFVTWEGVHGGGNPYLLPGEICVDANKSLWLGRAPAAVQVTSDLKLPFVKEMAITENHRIMTLSYLAWVMRYARGWLYRHQAPLIRGRRLVWELNIGSPTNSWMSSQISPQYRHIAKLAWKLSQSSVGITHDEAALALACGDIADDDIGEIGLDGIHLIPEFVAQVAGYAHSSQRRDGLHLLVDVGAGTVDIACFELWKTPATEMDSFPIRASLVEPLGTHFLMQNRMASLGVEGERWDDQAEILNIETFTNLLKISKEHCARADNAFADEVSKAICRVVAGTKAQDTKQHGYPRALEWTSGIPVFLTGGGSAAEVYATALANTFKKLNLPMLLTPLRPQLGGDTVSRDAERCFHRLSVAFGLTWDAESIGKIYQPKPPEIRAMRPGTDRPDRDDLYAK